MERIMISITWIKEHTKVGQLDYNIKKKVDMGLTYGPYK